MTQDYPTSSRDPAAAFEYEKTVVSRLLGPWVPDLIRSVALRPGERVLDVACGTGAVARWAARQVGSSGRVVGLDLDTAMIAVAREVTVGSAPKIEWILGDASSLPFTDGNFDVLFCQQGLQFFPDRPVALREMKRVLSPGGRVALAVWSRIEKNPYFLAVASAAGAHLGEEVGRQLRTAFALGDSAELRTLLAGNGFGTVEVAPVSRVLSLPGLGEFVPRHLASTSQAAVFAAATRETREAITARIAAELKIDASGKETALPFEILLAVLR